MKKTISIPSQTSQETWEKTAYHCPKCGEEQVWRMVVSVGAMAKHLCVATDCNTRFLMSVRIEEDESETHAERLQELAE